MTDEIWVLGATGRTGRGIARRFADSALPVVLAGRSAARLQSEADAIGAARVVAGSFDDQLAAIRRDQPRVVVNTVGPFARTAAAVVAACPDATHYVDIANELPAVEALLDGDATARETGRTVVTASGFGVLATECLVLELCRDRPPAARVRVDAIASLAQEDGTLGTALAATIVEGLPAGGRIVRDGQLQRSAPAAEPQRWRTPDGDDVTTATLPSGDLLAAWHASRARDVVAASSEIPSGPVTRVALPVLSALMRSAVVRRAAIRALARRPIRAADRPRRHSWGHAVITWPDGMRREAWLELGDAMEFTIVAAAEVATRLHAGGAQAGAFTPGALFGSSLATDLGGRFIL